MKDKSINSRSKHKCINCGRDCELHNLNISISIPLETPINTFFKYKNYLEEHNEIGNLEMKICSNCGMYHIYKDAEEIYPGLSDIPIPHEKMPESVKKIYNEAREVFPKSPRASTALLRLSLQILCKELGEEGKNINNDIHNLHQKGLNQKIINSLDIVRVLGNEAVHPGEIDLSDDKEIALNLFDIMNSIIEDTIASQIRNKNIEKIYSSLPESKVKAIENRDK